MSESPPSSSTSSATLPSSSSSGSFVASKRNPENLNNPAGDTQTDRPTDRSVAYLTSLSSYLTLSRSVSRILESALDSLTRRHDAAADAAAVRRQYTLRPKVGWCRKAIRREKGSGSDAHTHTAHRQQRGALLCCSQGNRKVNDRRCVLLSRGEGLRGANPGSRMPHTVTQPQQITTTSSE